MALSSDAIWLTAGFGGQAVFAARFLVQWLASEKQHQLTMKGADLRGAKLVFDVIPWRRKQYKPGMRVAWKQTHLKGASTDAETVVYYAPLK